MWIGLDVGTSAIKAAAYSPRGEAVAGSETATSLNRLPGGGVEQDMDEVWRAVSGVLSDLCAKIDVTQVRCLGVCAQGDGLWAVDDDGDPVGPAMLWNDTRAAADVLTLSESGALASVGRGCGTALWSGTCAPLWRWLRQNRSDESRKTAHVVTCADWICARLTGELVTDFSNASIPFLDFSTRAYGPAQIEALDCGDLSERLVQPQSADTMIGRVTADAAQATGLPEGLAVSVGTMDLAAMTVGLGLDRPGQSFMIIGTTAVVSILTDGIRQTDAPVGASALHPTSDAVIRVLAPTTGTGAFEWFAGLHPATLGGKNTALIADKMNRLVDSVPPGSNGVTFLPYLDGERAPFVAPDIRAGFIGMSAATTQADMARAVMEGTGFSLRHCIEEEGGLPEGAIRLTGGGSKNALWCQIVADIIGRPVVVSPASDHGLWGAACIGAAAAGYGSAVELSRRDEELATYAPDRQRRQAYDGVFARYRILSDSSRSAHRKLREIEG